MLKGGQATEELAGNLGKVWQYGIDGVPAFIMGNKVVVGAQPHKALETVLEELSMVAKPLTGL